MALITPYCDRSQFEVAESAPAAQWDTLRQERGEGLADQLARLRARQAGIIELDRLRPVVARLRSLQADGQARAAEQDARRAAFERAEAETAAQRERETNLMIAEREAQVAEQPLERQPFDREAEDKQSELRETQRRAEEARARAQAAKVAQSELRADLGLEAERVTLVSRDDVPEERRASEGYYDGNTGRAMVVEDNIEPVVGRDGQVLMDKRERRAWVAWHELYHQAKDRQDGRLGRVRNAQGYTAELERAATNPIVAKIADKIAKERGGKLTRGIAVEEALVEIAAAHETGRYDEIADRYGVPLTPALRRSIASTVRGFAARFKQWLAQTFGLKTKAWSDSDVYALLRSYKQEMGRASSTAASGMTMEAVVKFSPDERAPTSREGAGKAQVDADGKMRLRKPLDSSPRGAAPAARVLFEVAPDPNDAELSARWNRLPAQRRTEISERVVGEQLAPLLDALGVRGKIAPQVGSYLDDTNPSFSLTTSDPRAVPVAGAIGYAGAQDSMMVVHSEPFEGGEPVGAVRVTLPQEGFEFVRQVYDRLRRIEVGGERPVAGQTTVGREMLILNYSNVPTETLVKLVADELDSTFEVGLQSLFAAFPQKSEYEYASQDRGVRDARGVSATIPEWAEVLDRARRETTAAIRRELDGARQSIGRDEERAVPAGLAEPAVRSGRTGGSRGSGGPGSVEVVGIHYGKTKTPILSGSMFGSGIRGAEQRRIADAQDKRLKRRVYFYVGKRGQELPRPEAGLGPWVYRANLSNLYESGVSPALTYAGFSQGLNAEEVANNFESAVLDAGYDGYVSRSGGTVDVAVVLNRDVPAELMGSRAELGRAPVLESRAREMSQEDLALDKTGLDLDALNAELQMSSIEVAEEGDVDQYEAEFQRMMQRELRDAGETVGRLDELDRLPSKKLSFLTGTQTGKPIDLYNALPKEASDRLLKAWRAIAKKAGAFRFAKGSKKALPTFGKMPYDTRPLQQLADGMKLVEASQARARPGQPTIEKVEVKKTSPDYMLADAAARVVFHMSDGTRERAELWYHTDDDYDALGAAGFKGPLPYYTAHTMNLPANSGLGTYFYQLVAAYADRTGIPIMPDTGLTTINGYRRTEQMISAALRSGNPMAVFPGKRQEVFGWKEIANAEEADRNMVRLLVASARNAQATAPEIVDMVYDPQSDTFAFEDGRPGAEDIIALLTAKGGVEVDDGELRTDLDRRARELGVPPQRVIASNKRGYGRDTYARAVMSQMMVDGKKVPALSKPILYSMGRDQQRYQQLRSQPKVMAADVQEALIAQGVEAIERGMAERTAGKAPPSVTVGRTPHVLHMLGGRREALSIGGDTLRKVLADKHGMEVGAEVEQIVRGLYEPLAVFSGRAPGEFEIVAPIFDDDGHPLIMPVREGMDRTVSGEMMPARIRTAYHRPWTSIAGKLLYADVEMKTPAQGGGSAQGRDMPSDIEGGRTSVAGSGSTQSVRPGDFTTPLRQRAAKSSVKTRADLVNYLSSSYRGDLAQMPRFSMPRGNPLNSPSLPDETRWQAVRRKMQDNLLRMKQVQDLIAGRGGALTEASDVYRAEERMHGRIQSTLEDFKNEVMRPLMKMLADNDLSLDELALYAYAKHAPERNAYIASINPQLTAGSGMSDATAADILQRCISPDHAARFEQVDRAFE